MYLISEDDQILSRRKYPVSRFLLSLFSVCRNPLAHPTVMIRKVCIEKGYYYDETFLKAEDLELWFRLQKDGYHIANMPDYLLKYRVSDDMSQKRTGENWIYNHKARKKNFSRRNFVVSFLGIMVSFVYKHLPKQIITATYKKENRRNELTDDL
jgi:glycosyltransferase EpsE